MDLFGYRDSDAAINLLPYDGVVNYYGPIFMSDADKYLELLYRQIDWQKDRVMMFGKEIITKRQYAWYGLESYSYTYSGSKRTAKPMPTVLIELLSQVQKHTQKTFNACLLNLYHDGDEGMGWHSDDEPELVPESGIASVSLGAERVFKLKHKQTAVQRSIILQHGSLLTMSGQSQKHWLHQLPKSKRIQELRINLTFRKMQDWTIS